MRFQSDVEVKDRSSKFRRKPPCSAFARSRDFSCAVFARVMCAVSYSLSALAEAARRADDRRHSCCLFALTCFFPSHVSFGMTSTRSETRLVVGGICKAFALCGYFSHSLVGHLFSSPRAAETSPFTNCQVAVSDRAARRSAAIRGFRRRRSAGAAAAAAAWQWRSRPRCAPIGHPGSDGFRRRRTTA
jgi:hypothetical protein